VIAYFDTSALVKLVIDEEGHEQARALWVAARRVACGRLGYPEGRAALAGAARAGRLDADELRAAAESFDRRWETLRIVELAPRLAARAGALAERRALRGYDAVHLACALEVQGSRRDVILVCWDAGLRAGAAAEGVRLAPTQLT